MKFNFFRNFYKKTAIQERFKNRKELFNRECSISNEEITFQELNFTVASLSNVFYDDKYKLIMCAVPKAATSNWQRVLVRVAKLKIFKIF